jgi:glucan phosphoethanolaminetransferase (alkaline phosphatase superfamily)
MDTPTSLTPLLTFSDNYLLCFSFMSSVYQINKGINKPIEFKGLKAQYIWYLGGGLVCLMIVFAILYIAGLNIFICLVIIFSAGAALFMYVYKMSRRYGQYGLMKKIARRAVPKVIKSYSIVKLKKKLRK